MSKVLRLGFFYKKYKLIFLVGFGLGSELEIN